MEMKNIDQFFSTARERYRIKLKRDAGEPWPWTEDKIFREWRFCNVFREEDRSTTWLRENVRDPLRNSSPLILTSAIMFYRWFNRPEVGKIIKDLLLDPFDTEEAYQRLKDVKPVVTGAYMLRTPTGSDKLSGVLEYINNAKKLLPSVISRFDGTLEGAWTAIQGIDGMGPFTAAEVVQDLRWTPVLQDAPDVRTWTNPGPGCRRGLGYVVNGDRDHFTSKDRKAMIALMVEMLAMSMEEKNWPQNWPAWELHTVEFWNCEIWKYARSQRGESLKRKYGKDSIYK